MFSFHAFQVTKSRSYIDVYLPLQGTASLIAMPSIVVCRLLHIAYYMHQRYLKQQTHNLAITKRLVRCWNRLPEEVMDVLSLEMFKA